MKKITTSIKEFESLYKQVRQFIAKEALLYIKTGMMTVPEAKKIYMNKMAKLEEAAKKSGRKFSAKQLKIW